jgi:SAM-dependent methyltransferase
MSQLKCRFCSSALKISFADLGMSPLANAYIKEDHQLLPEFFYPLHVHVCSSCFLVQLPEWERRENLFCHYAYFSSYASSWLKHCSEYAVKSIRQFNLSSSKLVVEVASNDGYLLQYFKEHNIPILGIEPAENVAETAVKKGIPTKIAFFEENFAKKLVLEGIRADLLIANNVLAHVHELNDFVRAIETILSPSGVCSIEFPHLLRLIELSQFDTIYHEHFSYFSLSTVEKIFSHWGMKIFDVEELTTHGGSLRIYGCRKDNPEYSIGEAVGRVKAEEKEAGLLSIETYKSFQSTILNVKRRVLDFLFQANLKGETVCGYGAPAKGNTLLNYCGIKRDLLPWTVDLNPHKQNCLLPGTRIPIFSPERIQREKPDYIFILPWNLKDEIMWQCSFVKEWGGKFVTPIPKIKVWE